MAREVNISIANIHKTGVNVQIAQRAADITVQWVDDQGVSHTDSRANALIPNLWANAAIPDGWLQDRLIQLTVDAIRIIAGIDQP